MKLLVVGKGQPPLVRPANVIFAGSMPDVENAYAAADLFTFLPIYDAAANVVTEAFAAGLPVITTEYNGTAELVEPGVTGNIIRDPRETSTVVNAIQSWCQHHGKSRVTSRHNLDLARNVSDTLAVFELAARERIGGGRSADA